MTNTEFYKRVILEYDMDIEEKLAEIEQLEFLIDKLFMDVAMIKDAKERIKDEIK